MEDLTGKRLGQYQVIAPLGEGGMAAVFKAYQPSVDRQVALKILPRHFASDPEFTGRFEQEAKLIAKLQHVHILPVYDFGEAEGYTYIVMPFIETGTLTGLMAGKPMPLEQVRNVTTQVAEALAYAHERGLVHRDVKPSNILIDQAGNCLLTDFGIAKIVEGTTKFTQTGAIIGTPAYMSPEQIRGDRLDGRSDQYSLGIVVYEMATGRPPFRAETPPAIFVKHLHDPLPPPSSINPDLPEGLERVILKCLAKDPAARFPGMRQMIQALERAIPRRPEPQEGPPIGVAPTLREQAPEAVKAGPAAEPSAAEQARPSRAGVVLPKAEVVRGRRSIPTWFWALAGVAMLGGLASLGGLALWGASSRLAPTPTRPEPTAAPTSLPAVEQVEPTPQPAASAAAIPAVDGCSDPLGCAQIGPGEPVHIGYLLTLSGPTAFLGRDSLGGIELAVDDRGGSLLGRQILLTGEDSGCSAEGGLAAAVKLKLMPDQSLIGIIGTSCSSAMTAAIGTISDAGLTIISPSNTSPTLTLESGSWQPGYFRTAHSDLFQGWLGATFAREVLGVRTAATIHDGSPYAEQLQGVFANTFQELGGRITFQGQVHPRETDLGAVLEMAASGSPELLYFPLFEPQGSLLVQQVRKQPGLADSVLMSGDSLFMDSFPESAGAAAVGMYLSAPYVTGPAYGEFLAKWEVKFGGVPPSGFHAFAYDAANILFDAIERVAGQGPDGTLYVGRQALREAVTATAGFEGLTGLLDCGDKDFGEQGISHGDCATGQALGVFVIDSAEVSQARWPPKLVWTPDQAISR